ncbi:unnamed protein product [Boreogadus saida]
MLQANSGSLFSCKAALPQANSGSQFSCKAALPQANSGSRSAARLRCFWRTLVPRPVAGLWGLQGCGGFRRTLVPKQN